MALLDKTGITSGQNIESSHVTNVYDALTGVGSYAIAASGSLIGTASYALNSKNSDLLYISEISSSTIVTGSYKLLAALSYIPYGLTTLGNDAGYYGDLKSGVYVTSSTFEGQTYQLSNGGTYIGNGAGFKSSFNSTMVESGMTCIGNGAGAMNLYNIDSTIIGASAGLGFLMTTPGFVRSVLIGSNAAYVAGITTLTPSKDIIAIGSEAAAGADVIQQSIAIGTSAAYGVEIFTDSIAIGISASREAYQRNTVNIGNRSGIYSYNTSSINIGTDAGRGISGSKSVSIGHGAGYWGPYAVLFRDTGSVWVGHEAGGISDAGIFSAEPNMYIGKYNIGIGYRAGGAEWAREYLGTSHSIYIGYNVEYDAIAREGGGNSNIIIGNNIALPSLDSNGDSTNQHANIGNVFYIAGLNGDTSNAYPETDPLNGRVAIGKLPGIYQFEVNLNSAAKPSSTTWQVSSDARLKENIEEANYDTCYDIVKNLSLKRYTWKSEVYNTEQVADRSKIGWIADDVETVFPKAVITASFFGSGSYDASGSFDGFYLADCKSLDSDQIYAAMYGAVKKLIVENESLKLQVSASNSEILAIKTHLGL